MSFEILQDFDILTQNMQNQSYESPKILNLLSSYPRFWIHVYYNTDHDTPGTFIYFSYNIQILLLRNNFVPYLIQPNL